MAGGDPLRLLRQWAKPFAIEERPVRRHRALHFREIGLAGAHALLRLRLDAILEARLGPGLRPEVLLQVGAARVARVEVIDLAADLRRLRYSLYASAFIAAVTARASWPHRVLQIVARS